MDQQVEMMKKIENICILFIFFNFFYFDGKSTFCASQKVQFIIIKKPKIFVDGEGYQMSSLRYILCTNSAAQLMAKKTIVFCV